MIGISTCYHASRRHNPRNVGLSIDFGRTSLSKQLEHYIFSVDRNHGNNDIHIWFVLSRWEGTITRFTDVLSNDTKCNILNYNQYREDSPIYTVAMQS